MHKLLKRQLKRNLLGEDIPTELKPLLNAIDRAYTSYENEGLMLERSLELVSDELNERNEELRNKVQQLEETLNQLGNSVAVLNGVFNATGEIIFAFNNDNELICYNQAAEEMLKYHQNKANKNNESVDTMYAGSLLFKILKDPSEFIHEINVLGHNPRAELFGVIELKDGRLFEYHSSPQFTNDRVVGRVWCYRNVTQIKENEALVQYQAFHDALTKLPNRILLQDRLGHAIALCQRHNEMLAILFIDLDHFKKVNDTVGHKYGDELLVDVSQRIRACLREHDTLARFGGDEFVVLLEKIKSHQSAAQTSKRIIDQLKIPFELSGKSFHISSSIGVSMYPRDDVDAEELIRKADLAMYHAKENGRSNFEFFNTPLERIAHFQLDLENKLRNAINNNELEVFYQPLVKSKNLSVEKMEALLRWFPENGHTVSPADFIPVAERSGLIDDIGRWVLKQVCLQIHTWRKMGIDNVRVSVNLSAVQFNDINLVNDVEKILKETQVEGKGLEFEITESMILEDLERVRTVLEHLRALDISIAIDDFGTGYSSMKYLQKLPLDNIKIDRSFILPQADNIDNETIVNAIISLGHNLKLSVVAEGVEDKETVDFLRNRNCDYIQGYYFYRPMPADEVTEVLLEQLEE